MCVVATPGPSVSDPWGLAKPLSGLCANAKRALRKYQPQPSPPG